MSTIRYDFSKMSTRIFISIPYKPIDIYISEMKFTLKRIIIDFVFDVRKIWDIGFEKLSIMLH